MKTETPICDKAISEFYDLEGVAGVSPYIARKLETENKRMRELLEEGHTTMCDLDVWGKDEQYASEWMAKVRQLLKEEA